ncbi:MAG: AraC family transcriptional regulator [Clostridia bacterium]|nr:AraC family transcriptional regulator [Clostridia bacterium]
MAIYETQYPSFGFQKEIFRYQKNLTFHAHLHANFELLRVKSGRLHVWIEGEEYVLTEGQQILILPQLIHSYQTSAEGSLSQFIIFSADYLPELDAQVRGGERKDPVLATESFSLFDLLLHYSKRDHCMFRSVLYQIASFYEANQRINGNPARKEAFSLWLSDYLEAHCTENLDEKSVAKAAGYHPRYLSSLVNRNFGVSFQTLLNEYRIRLAVTLLSDESKSITQIYGMAGFESQSSFNRNFKRIMGMTPREYRTGKGRIKPIHE